MMLLSNSGTDTRSDVPSPRGAGHTAVDNPWVAVTPSIGSPLVSSSAPKVHEIQINMTMHGGDNSTDGPTHLSNRFLTVVHVASLLGRWLSYYSPA